MRRLAIGLCLAACMGTSAVAATTASAEAPEFGRCVKQVAVGKVFHGKYANSKCTIAVTPEEEAKKGKFEWFPGPGPNNLFTTTIGFVVLHTVNGPVLTCAAGTGAGEVLAGNNKEESLTITFTGCHGNVRCSSEGKGIEEITTNPPIGEVGWRVKAERKTALALRAAPGYEGLIAQFKCLGIDVELRGGVLVQIKNDKMTPEEVLKFSTNSKGVQKTTVWRVGEPEEESVLLEAQFEHGGFRQTGLSAEATIVSEEALELNAVL